MIIMSLYLYKILIQLYNIKTPNKILYDYMLLRVEQKRLYVIP